MEPALLVIGFVVCLSGKRRLHVDHHAHESYLHHRLAGLQDRNRRRIVTRIVRVWADSHEVEGIRSRRKVYSPLLLLTIDSEGLAENLWTHEESMDLDIELGT